MESRRDSNAAKPNAINPRKIVIKRVTSLPKDKKRELYNPFSCVAEDNSPTDDNEVKIYDPFEPTISDEDKNSPGSDYCNPENPEKDIEPQTTVSNTPPIKKADAKLIKTGKGNDPSPEKKRNKPDKVKVEAPMTPPTKPTRREIDEMLDDIFMDEDGGNRAAETPTNEDNYMNDTNKEDSHKNQENKEIEICDTRLIVLGTTDEKQSPTLSIGTSQTNVITPMKLCTEEFSDSSPKDNGHRDLLCQDQKMDTSTETMLDEFEKPTKAIVKDETDSRHRERKKHHKRGKDADSLEGNKKADAKNAKSLPKYPLEEIDVEIEEFEVLDEDIKDIKFKKRNTKHRKHRKSTTREDSVESQDLKKTIGSDKEVSKSRNHKRTHSPSLKSSHAEEPKSRHKKAKRKSTTQDDIDSENEVSKSEKKRKNSVHEIKYDDSRAKKKSYTSSNHESSKSQHRENRRQSANSDQDNADSRHVKKKRNENKDFSDSDRESRRVEKRRKSDKEKESHKKKRIEDNKEYSKLEREPRRHQERRKSYKEDYDKKRKDRNHDEGISVKRHKHHRKEEDNFNQYRRSKSRKSSSIEPNQHNRHSHPSKSSDRDSQKRKAHRTKSSERGLNMKSEESTDQHRRKQTSHKLSQSGSDASPKRKDRERSNSWRTIDIEEGEIISSERYSSMTDLYQNEQSHSENNDKAKRPKTSKRDSSPDHHSSKKSSKHPSHSKKSKHKHSKTKRSSSLSSAEDHAKGEKKSSSKHKKKKKKRRSSIESADSPRLASLSLDSYDGEPRSKEVDRADNISLPVEVNETDDNIEKRRRTSSHKSDDIDDKTPVATLQEDPGNTDSFSPPHFHESDEESLPKKSLTPDQTVVSDLSMLDNSLSQPDSPAPSKLSPESPLKNVTETRKSEISSPLPVLDTKVDVKSHHSIKESLSFAEEFVEQSRKRWKEKKSSVASSNESPQLCVLSDSESKTNHRSFTETVESNGNNKTTPKMVIPGLDISMSPINDTDLRFHDTDARPKENLVDIFEDSQSVGTPQPPVDNGVPSDDEIHSGDVKKSELSPSDMILDSDDSESSKGNDINNISGAVTTTNNIPVDSKRIVETLQDGKKALLNPTQILNSIGLNPQQHSAAQNAILSIAELSKHLHLDKFSDNLIKTTGQTSSDTPIESSAVELHNKDKKRGHLKKLKFQEQVIEEAKSAIKPYYERRQISKTEYKDILKKAVNKIYSSEVTHEVNTVKIRRLIRRYIEKYQQKSSKKKDKTKSKEQAWKSPPAPQYQPLVQSASDSKASMSYPLPFSKREQKKTYTLPDLPLPPPPPPPKR